MTPTNPPTLEDLTPLVRSATGADVAQPTVGERGWRMRLAPADPPADPPREAEYVSAPPRFVSANGVLLVATFIPYVDNSGDHEERCGNVGFGRLYGFEATTGNSVFADGDRQYYEFSDTMITNILDYVVEDEIVILLSYQGTGDGINPLGPGLGTLDDTFPNPPPPPPNMAPHVPHMQYWREVF